MKLDLTILHLEDNDDDIELIQRALRRSGLQCRFIIAKSHADYLAAIAGGHADLILSDQNLPGFDGFKALEIARQQCPATPFLFVSGSFCRDTDLESLKAAGAADCITKGDLNQLAPAIMRAITEQQAIQPYNHPMERLVSVIQELSLARTLEAVIAIVRRTARALTGADGATFILRDGDQCYYVDEDAISPLWKGQRFPMSACISGWAMINRQQVTIEDIYTDPRIPVEAYRPTFVKSLVMVPIRTINPIGAIGNYWAERRQPEPLEIKLLQALADTTAVALENVQVYTELEARVRARTRELEHAYKEMEAFSYAVSHDLRAPLRSIDGFTGALLEDYAQMLPEPGQDYLKRICNATQRMSQLIEDLLSFARTTQTELKREPVDLSQLAREIATELQASAPQREVTFVIAERLITQGDPRLLRIVMVNLLGNAWKFTAKQRQGRIEVGAEYQATGPVVLFVRDNGVGFDMSNAGKLFGVFQRFHSEQEFTGTGVGLATVQRIIDRHGGHIWAEAAIGEGACFYFTLAEELEAQDNNTTS